MVSVDGWMWEGNTVRFLRHLSAYVGYRYDDADEDALTGALDVTDDETADAWFEHPLVGAPLLRVFLARAVSSAVISVRVEGDIDAILAARIETMLHLLSDDA
ncbi:hypothetical protein AB0M79_26685 [Polymorphospora sp. NPDC051019]|uniref:hypothetical protein n=1 Tax=Polymorphospora sp. NPDC051019 TaxID=3155725 RepID=UPI00341DD666